MTALPAALASTKTCPVTTPPGQLIQIRPEKLKLGRRSWGQAADHHLTTSSPPPLPPAVMAWAKVAHAHVWLYIGLLVSVPHAADSPSRKRSTRGFSRAPCRGNRTPSSHGHRIR